MYQEQRKELQNLFSHPAHLPSLPPGPTATQFPPTTVHRVDNSPIVSYTTQTARTQGRICLYNKLSAPHIKMHFFLKKKLKNLKNVTLLRFAQSRNTEKSATHMPCYKLLCRTDWQGSIIFSGPPENTMPLRDAPATETNALVFKRVPLGVSNITE